MIAPAGGRAPGRRRSLPRGRRRQGDRAPLRHRQQRLRPVRLLAGRRLRLRRQRGLRPQEGRASPPAARGSASSTTSSNLGTDVQTQPFTVAGIGDMAGDVFGNGLLHEPGHEARGRLQPPPHLHRPRSRPRSGATRSASGCSSLPRSTWKDYDAKLISKGGGIFDRSAKAIPLSAGDAEAARPRGRARARRGGDPPHPHREGGPPLQRRHRHLREGLRGGGRRGGRPRQRPRAGGRQGGPRARGGRGRQPRASPSAAGWSTRRAAGSSTPTRWTTPAAWTCPTTR